MVVGIGVDVVEIERLRGVLARQKERFLSRVFTEGEQEYCRRYRDPSPHYAARFAAKEAAFKALGTGWSSGVTWLDAEVCRLESGAPQLLLRGAAARLAETMGVKSLKISLSHSDTVAMAIVILEA